MENAGLYGEGPCWTGQPGNMSIARKGQQLHLFSSDTPKDLIAIPATSKLQAPHSQREMRRCIEARFGRVSSRVSTLKTLARLLFWCYPIGSKPHRLVNAPQNSRRVTRVVHRDNLPRYSQRLHFSYQIVGLEITIGTWDTPLVLTPCLLTHTFDPFLQLTCACSFCDQSLSSQLQHTECAFEMPNNIVVLG